MNRNRKIIGLVFLVGLLSAIAFLGFKVVNRKETLQKASDSTRTLSRVSDELTISLKEFLKPTLLVYINSECEHCQWQLKELLKIENELANIQVVLISIEPLDSLHRFLLSIPFENPQYFDFYEVEPEKVKAAFGSSGTPQIFIYQNNQLVKYFKGEVRVELIVEALNQS